MTHVSFPGLFDGIMNINPVALSFLGLSIHWYGIIICLGIVLSVISATRYAHREGISTDDVLDFALFAVPIAIIGARLYYVLTSADTYDSFMEVIAIWNGGLAIYGAVIAGAITVLVVAKIKKIPFFKIGDAAAASVLIGQAVGRWGNFCNGEAYGHLDRIEFLGRVIETPKFTESYILRMAVQSNATSGRLFVVHPTFLYESVWNLIGFILISLLYKKKRFDGQIVLYYLAWYGLGRFFIEGLRADSLMLGNSDIRISQLLALLTFIFAVITLIAVLIIRKRTASNDDYKPQFTSQGSSEEINKKEITAEVENNGSDIQVTENITEEK